MSATVTWATLGAGKWLSFLPSAFQSWQLGQPSIEGTSQAPAAMIGVDQVVVNALASGQPLLSCGRGDSSKLRLPSKKKVSSKKSHHSCRSHSSFASHSV